MRIDETVQRGRKVMIRVEDKEIAAYEGETVATALLASGVRRLRSSPAGGQRGMFCAIGVCQECVVEVNGLAVASCQLPVTADMQIRLRVFIDEEH